MLTHAAPAREVDAPQLASWQTTHPWRWAIAVGVGGTLLTAFGVGFSQVLDLGPAESTLFQAGFIGLSALVGLVIMWRTRPPLSHYGFRRPANLDRTLWLLPLAVVPVIVLILSGIHVSPVMVGAFAVFAIAVGFNEEIWFRGLLLAALRSLGERRAVVAGSIVFGALHLTNLFTGQPPLYVALQFALACLAGLVLAELVAITGSLWIGIGWHLVYDLVALSSGDGMSTRDLFGAALMTAILGGYAIWLWRHVPATKPQFAQVS